MKQTTANDCNLFTADITTPIPPSRMHRSAFEMVQVRYFWIFGYIELAGS